MRPDTDGPRIFAELIKKASSKRRIDEFLQGLPQLVGLLLENSSEVVIDGERGAHPLTMMPHDLMSRHQIMRVGSLTS